MKASPNKHFITVLFGPLGDTLMALALYDDLLTLVPDATLLILTRRNAAMITALASEYPGIEVREIPRGFAALSFFARILFKRGSTLLTLGLVSVGYSCPLRAFFWALKCIPGNRLIGFHDPLFDVTLDFDISKLMIENLRRLLPYAVPGSLPVVRQPQVRLCEDIPAHFQYEKGKYIVLHLFGVSIPHTLPPERWRRIFARLRAAYPAYPLILTGTKSQQQSINEVANGMEGVHTRTDFSLSGLAYVIDNAALYIGIDTGVTHMAGLLQQKSLVIRHCSDPTWLPTYNKNARILLNSSRCTEDEPMLCAIVAEEGREYRRSTYDISDELIFDSVALAFSSNNRSLPLFPGIIDEKEVDS